MVRTQWNIVAEKIMELGNLIFVGLVVTQVFPLGRFNTVIAIVGLGVTIFTYIVAFMIMRGGGKI